MAGRRGLVDDEEAMERELSGESGGSFKEIMGAEVVVVKLFPGRLAAEKCGS